MRYVISYDLNDPGQNYASVTNAITELGGQRVLLSQWVVNRTGTNATGIRNYIWAYMDANDRLLVNSLESADWAGFNLLIDPHTV